MTGKGAAAKGARWNHAGEHVAYASMSISLAAWETRAHFGKGARLPWNRYLVRIDVPEDVWAARQIMVRPPSVGWDVIPEGLVSRSARSAWLNASQSALLAVPSALIYEDHNGFINRAHPDESRISETRMPRSAYDRGV